MDLGNGVWRIFIENYCKIPSHLTPPHVLLVWTLLRKLGYFMKFNEPWKKCKQLSKNNDNFESLRFFCPQEHIITIFFSKKEFFKFWNIKPFSTYIKDNILTVICFEPSISGLQFFLPFWYCSFGYLNQNRVCQFCLFYFLLKLKRK